MERKQRNSYKVKFMSITLLESNESDTERMIKREQESYVGRKRVKDIFEEEFSQI